MSRPERVTVGDGFRIGVGFFLCQLCVLGTVLFLFFAASQTGWVRDFLIAYFGDC